MSPFKVIFSTNKLLCLFLSPIHMLWIILWCIHTMASCLLTLDNGYLYKNRFTTFWALVTFLIYVISMIFSTTMLLLLLKVYVLLIYWGFPGGSDSKEFPCSPGDQDLIPGSGRPLEKEMATHSSILTWRIPWTEEPGNPWGHKQLNTTEWLTLSLSFIICWVK